jgi:Fe2+ or Zn2+ uptake regulation protein
MFRLGNDRQSATIQKMLRSVGMRLPRQRIALASLLLRSENRRESAETLYEKAREARSPVSTAAVATRCAGRAYCSAS